MKSYEHGKETRINDELAEDRSALSVGAIVGLLLLLVIVGFVFFVILRYHPSA